MIVSVKGVTITVVNRKTTPGGEYVGRPSPLGNPMKIGDFKRAEAIQAYADWLYFKVKTKEPKVCKELERLRKKAIKDKQLVLACWCVPMRCHASVIAETLAKAIASGSTF